jgi:hypothetical protein
LYLKELSLKSLMPMFLHCANLILVLLILHVHASLNALKNFLSCQAIV